MIDSKTLKEDIQASIKAGLNNEDPDVVAKFVGHGLAFLRMFPVPVEDEVTFRSPPVGALKKYAQAGTA